MVDTIDWITVPTQALLQTWLRKKHNIDVYILPVFRDKCGYDSFKRDGYTYEIMKIEPCQYLVWSDLNQCAEDRDEENKEKIIGERCLKPSLPNYEDVLEIGLFNALNIL